MRAYVDRVRNAGRRFSRRAPDGQPTGIADARRRARWTAPVSVLVVALAVAGVGAAVLLGRAHSVRDLLSVHAADASAAAAPLPPTLLAALPRRAIANGTAALTVTLSAPVASGSPPPSLNPAVAGVWSAVGDSEVFKPVSTLEPCSNYTLSVWAAHELHRPRAARPTAHDRPARGLPPDRRPPAGAGAPGLPRCHPAPPVHSPHPVRPRDPPRSGRTRLPPTPRPARPPPLRRTARADGPTG